MKKLLSLIILVFSFVFANAQTDSLKQYTGKYKFPDGSAVTEITISVENGILMASSAMGNSEFKPTSTADEFEVVAYGGAATFKRKEGKIIGLQIQVQDVNMEGVKQDEK